jgi:hypothetical protein
MSIFTSGDAQINGIARKLALAAAGSVVIPQGAVVRKIFIRNKTANAVTGGIKIGTTVGGVDVVTAQALAANAVVSVTPLIDAINTAAVRTLYIDAVTAWNSASVDVAVEYTDLV